MPTLEETKFSAEQGDAMAQYLLGRLLEVGNGVTKDLDESERWYRRAAQQGLRDAQLALDATTGVNSDQLLTARLTLSATVGNLPMTRTTINQKLWAYIQQHSLQDKTNPHIVHADGALRIIFFGKTEIDLADLAILVNHQVTPAVDPPEHNVGTKDSFGGGYIYVLVNSSLPGLLKIGYTDRDPKLRAAELSADSGVAVPFIVAYHTEVSNAAVAEEEVHEQLSAHRVNDNREFFRMEVRDAISAIESVCLRYAVSPQGVEKEVLSKIQRDERLEEWAGAAAAYLYRKGYIDYKLIRSSLGFQIEYEDSLQVFEILRGRGLVRKDGHRS